MNTEEKITAIQNEIDRLFDRWDQLDRLGRNTKNISSGFKVIIASKHNELIALQRDLEV